MKIQSSKLYYCITMCNLDLCFVYTRCDYTLHLTALYYLLIKCSSHSNTMWNDWLPRLCNKVTVIDFH